MRIRDILVHLDATGQARTRLALAAELARRQGAHLIGLHAFDVTLPFVAPDAGGAAAVVSEVLERMREEARAAASGIEAAFQETVQRQDLSGEWRLVEGPAPEQVTLHGRYADLLVLGQADPASGDPAAEATVEAALFSSGRPVLVVPHAGRFESPGRRVLIGWNASREATRAVHDALPLITAAEIAAVLSINPRQGIAAHGEEPGADIARHLARHGVRVRVERTEAPEIGAADALLNRAAEMSADLLVVGGYGHSRFREMFLGGVTRSLLRQMTLPVLMSH